MIFILIFITALLGCLRDYVKYKIFSFKKFIRTPIITLSFTIFFLQFYKIDIALLLAIIFERWFFLLIKSAISILNNDYHLKKNKYILKYNLKYKN